MKLLKNNFPLFKLGVLAVLAATLMISSCNDNDDPKPDQQASLKVINGVPQTSAYVLKLNGTALNNDPLAFKSSLDYKQVAAGPTELVITEQSSGQIAGTSAINLPSGTSSSLYLVSDPEGSKVTSFTIKDDFSTVPAAGKARIRFVNVSNTTGPLDLTIEGQTTPLFTNIAFKGSTNFIDVDAGKATSFVITETGTTNTLFKLESVTVAQGTFTTLWATNPITITETAKVSLGVIKNK